MKAVIHIPKTVVSLRIIGFQLYGMLEGVNGLGIFRVFTVLHPYIEKGLCSGFLGLNRGVKKENHSCYDEKKSVTILI